MAITDSDGARVIDWLMVLIYRESTISRLLVKNKEAVCVCYYSSFWTLISCPPFHYSPKGKAGQVECARLVLP